MRAGSMRWLPMKVELSRVFFLLAAFYASDLISSIFSLAWGIPEPLSSNWVFVASLAVSHLLVSFTCTSGMKDRNFALISAVLSAALSYALFCVVSVNTQLLLRSTMPLASLELGALAGAMISRPGAGEAPAEIPRPPPGAQARPDVEEAAPH